MLSYKQDALVNLSSESAIDIADAVGNSYSLLTGALLTAVFTEQELLVGVPTDKRIPEGKVALDQTKINHKISNLI